MNDEMLRLSLIDVMNNDLLNYFVNTVFDYDLKNNESIYIQYKIVNNNIILNLFDNSKSNRFKAYIFTMNIPSKKDEDSFYINIIDMYNDYCNKKNINKLTLLASLIYTKNSKEKKEIINSLFDNESIRKIFYNYFI